jgi:hypothetical protein
MEDQLLNSNQSIQYVKFSPGGYPLVNKTGNVSDYKINDVLVYCLFQSITCV